MTIPDFNDIIEQNDQTAARRENLDKLRELVGNVYPNKFERSTITGGEDTITAVVGHGPIPSRLLGDRSLPGRRLGLPHVRGNHEKGSGNCRSLVGRGERI